MDSYDLPRSGHYPSQGSSVGQGGLSAPPRTQPILASLSELSQNRMMLEKMLATLFERLRPVLNPPSTEGGGGARGTAPDPPRSELDVALREESRALDNMGSGVAHLLDRLAI